VARETGTAIEINAQANLACRNNPSGYLDEYADYLGILAEQGCMFSPGSDAHDKSHLAAIRAVWDMFERLKLGPERIWRPAGKPFAGPGR
jgi:histidinol phosphatase-like PHP family hydrolase